MLTEHCEFYMWMGHQGTVDMHMPPSSLLTYMLHYPTGPHLQNTKLKDKTTKKSEKTTAED